MDDFVSIPDFPDYFINRKGDVLSKIKRKEGKIMKQKNHKNGYIFISLRKDKKPYTESIHRLVAKTFIPNPNSYRCVDHINRDKKDNRLDNLRYVNSSINCLNVDYTGAYQMKSGSWYSKCRGLYLGTFKTYEEAKDCYVNYKSNLINNFLIENEVIANNLE